MNDYDDILRLADHCVKCGLCLPQCPTYQLSRNENESPRGRIALMQALAANQLDARDDSLYRHLDNCLLCRRCEYVCPSGVQYGRIMDRAREHITQQRPPSRSEKFGRQLLSRHMPGVYQALRLYQKSGAQKLLRPVLKHNKKLDYLQNLMPPLPSLATFKSDYPVKTKTTRQVAIFTGCMGTSFDAPTLDAAVTLLNALGYRVRLPDKPHCCGALQQHRGQAAETQALAMNNLQIFAEQDDEAVLFLASGCGAQLLEYPQRDWEQDQQRQKAEQLQKKLQDISSFLLKALQKNPLSFRPLNKCVVVHQPCSQRHVLGLPDVAAQLLAQIPDLQLRSLPDTSACCGAAGDYMLRHPQTAQALRQHLLDKILLDETDIIVSTNIGCSLFIQAGIEERGIRVMHPVQLLMERYRGKDTG